MRINMLTASRIKSAPDGLHADGGCLYLRKRGGSSSWIFRFSWEGKRHDIGLGSVALVTLAEARRKALNLRHDIANGVHPVISVKTATKHKRVQALLAKGAGVTVSELMQKALEWHAESKGIKNKKWPEYNLSLYRKHMEKPIGDTPISLLTRDDVVAAVQPVWHTYAGPQLVALLGHMYKYAKLKGLFVGETPVSKDSGLFDLLPARRGQAQHLASAPWEDVPSIYKKVGPVLKFIILCVPRIMEALKIRGEDVDIQKRKVVLRAPKNGKPFVIPIPRQAVALLPQGNGYIFSPEMSREFLGIKLRDELKAVADVTVHGFRASFSTWCAEHEKSPEVREACLQHSLGSKVTLSYQRSDLLKRREVLLQEWADYVTGSSA